MRFSLTVNIFNLILCFLSVRKQQCFSLTVNIFPLCKLEVKKFDLKF